MIRGSARESGEPFESFSFFNISNTRFSHRVGQDVDAAVVGVAIDRMRMAVFAAVGVAVVGPVFGGALQDGRELVRETASGGGVAMGGGGVVDQLRQERECANGRGSDAFAAQ